MKRFLLRPPIVLVFVVMIWGSTFVVTKYALEQQVPPLLYIAVRYVLGSLFLLSLWRFLESKKEGARPGLFDGLFWKSLTLGILQALGIIFQVFGQLFTTASKSAFLTAFSIPLVPILGWIFYKERPKPMQLLAVLVGVGGLFLLTYPQAGVSLNIGDVFTLACAFVYGVTIITTARFSKTSYAFRLATGQTVVVTFVVLALLLMVHLLPSGSLPFFTVKEHQTWHLSIGLLLSWFYMSFVCIAIAFSLQMWAMAQMKATQSAVIFALEPVCTTLIALLAFGAAEFPKTRGIIGAVLILLAVFFSELQFTKKQQLAQASTEGR